MTALAKETNPLTKPLSNRQGVALICALVGLAFVIWAMLAWLNYDVHRGPSFIDDLRAGVVPEASIKSVEILQFDVRAGWPFSEPEYDHRAHKKIESPEIKHELISMLRNSSTRPNKDRNHTSTPYYGILRIDLDQGGHYYVFYQLGYGEGNYYTYVNANPKKSTNPNSAESFENVPLAEFLKRNDPWYRDVASQ